MHRRFILYSLLVVALLSLGAYYEPVCGAPVTNLPSDDTFITDGALADQGEKRQAFEDVRDVVAELPGGDGVEDLTISGGSITPTKAVLRVDTQSAAATDDLDTINVTNHPDGRLLILGINDSGRHVVLIHNPGGGTGALDLTNFGGLDLELNNTSMFAVLQRRGSIWLLLDVWGREDTHKVGDSGEPAYQNGWSEFVSGRGAKFWKDSSGIVHLSGGIDSANPWDPATENLVFTLPPGYRPGEVRNTGVIDLNGNVLLRLRIQTSGDVEVVEFESHPGGTFALVDLSFSFRAEQ